MGRKTHSIHGRDHLPTGMDPIPKDSHWGCRVEGSTECASGVDTVITGYDSNYYTDDLNGGRIIAHTDGLKILRTGLIEAKASIYGMTDTNSFVGVVLDIYNISDDSLYATQNPIHWPRQNYTPPADSNRRYWCDAIIIGLFDDTIRYGVLKMLYFNGNVASKTPYAGNLWARVSSTVNGNAGDASF